MGLMQSVKRRVGASLKNKFCLWIAASAFALEIQAVFLRAGSMDFNFSPKKPFFYEMGSQHLDDANFAQENKAWFLINILTK